MFRDKKNKICATVEARMTSSRLPGKVLLDLAGKPSLQHIIERIGRSKYIDEVIVATTVNDSDNPIVDLCKKIGCKFYRGSEQDVLLRVLDSAKSVNADLIVEITGDCPMIDWDIIDNLIEIYFLKNYDFVSNGIERSFPRGFDTDIFSVSILEEVNDISKSPVDHEHVSLYIYSHPEKYRLYNLFAEGEYFHPEFEVTLDTPSDYELIRNIYENLYPSNFEFSALDVIKFLKNNPTLLEEVNKIKRKDPNVEKTKEKINGI